MSSVSSIVATAIAALLPLAGVTGPVDAQEMLSQPESATSTENLPSGELAVPVSYTHLTLPTTPYV